MTASIPGRGITYRWPPGGHGTHFHDPVDEVKLRSWTGLEPIETSIVDDGKPRLIAVYDPQAGVR